MAEVPGTSFAKFLLSGYRERGLIWISRKYDRGMVYNNRSARALATACVRLLTPSLL
jgi:hypothetical protein